MRLWTAD